MAKNKDYKLSELGITLEDFSLNQIEKFYREGRITLQEAQEYVDYWNKIFPKDKVIIKGKKIILFSPKK